MIRPRATLAALVLLTFLGCHVGHDHAPPAAPEGENWSVTAWGGRYEVFAETDPLVAGQPATCNAHVTILDDFAPLREGKVAAVLRGAGADQSFDQHTPLRAGIYPVVFRPGAEGTFDLVFVIDGPAGHEEIAAGKVRVGTVSDPGGSIAAAPPAAAGGTVSFLKEQQWQTGFATAWVAEGALRESVGGPGRVTAAAGGETMLTAAVDATVAPEPWPFPGLDVPKGRAVFRLLPRVGGRSLPDLRAEAAGLAAEVEAARRRADRLADLLKVEAASVAEVERARATLTGLEARLRAAEQGVGAATSQDGAGSDAALDAALAVQAPWSGRVAAVAVSPGQTVTAGTPLARLVKVRPLWIVVALRPGDAARVSGRPAGLLIRRSGSPGIQEVTAPRLRLVSRSPEVDRATATIDLILEVDFAVSDLPIGTAIEADLLLAGERRGIVVPADALVDDGGVTVVYVQIEGESFVRRELRVLGRLGSQVMVEGVVPGERLVTRGGGAIRRSALLDSGAPEGHVH